MRKIMLDIPDTLDREIAVWLLCSELEPRDKSRAILYAIKQMLSDKASQELLDICKIAKDAIRERAKQRCNK